MRLLAFALATLALAACAASPSLPVANSATAANATATVANSPLNDTLGLAPAAGVTPDTTRLRIHSVGLIVWIHGVKHSGYINGSCWLYQKGKYAVGCVIRANKTMYVRLIGGLFTGYDAKGCLAAVTRWQGTMHKGQDLPLKWLWTGKCH